MLSIREYVHQLDWDNICKIHDKARILELEESAPKEAFIPLEECYKVEKLFDSIIFVAEQNNETIGFVAFCNNLPDPPDPADPAEVVSRSAVRSLPSTRRGPGLRELNKLPQTMVLYEA